MGETEYITKKEIIEELLYKDRNFFSSNNPEFNIFKYTSFFAVLTFTFQFIIVIINSFRGFGYPSMCGLGARLCEGLNRIQNKM